MTVNIRQADSDDVEALYLMIEALFNESPTYALKPLVRSRVIESLNVLIDSNDTLVLLAENDGEPIGYFIGGYSVELFSYDKTAFDISIFVKPEFRRKTRAALTLIKVFEEWCHDFAIKNIVLGISTGIHIEQTGRFYKFLGYKDTGLILEKKL